MRKLSITNSFWARLLGLAILLVATTVLHAQGLEHKVDFYLEGKVGTETVKPGSYTIAYPDADSGSLQIKVGKKVVTASFTRQAIDAQANVDKMTYRENTDGSRAIATITPRGKKFTLVLQ
jgi:hypothetical protein